MAPPSSVLLDQPPTCETTARPGRILELDGLRGIAVLVIVVYHYIVAAPETTNQLVSRLQSDLRIGWFGVDLFFVLSGFLIGGILLDAKGSGRYFRTFYAR